MLGLDSVSLPFIVEHRRQLPFLASLLESGTLRDLRSPAVYFSDSIWPTFASGKTPGEHGQYFPFQWVAKHHQYRRIADPRWPEKLDVEPFWHRIAEAGIPAIAFDVAHTLHDERAPCLQITNWSYQSSGNAKASQPEVLKDLRRRFGHRPIGVEVPVPKTLRQCDAIRDRMIAAVRAKADATLHLMNRPWNLFVTGWFELHRAGHNLWPVDGDFASDASPDAMLAVYEEADRQLGRVIAAAEAQGGETSLLVFALHGMEPNRTQVHFLSEILLRLNRLYLGVTPKRSSRPAALNPMAFLRHVLPPGLQHWAANMLGERVQDWVVNRALTGGREWSATPSFPVLSGGEGFIRLNMKGRETPGFFDPGSAELGHYAEWLKARLSAIEVVETGEPLIRRIVDIDDALPGPRRHFLPDLVLEWAPDAPVHRIRSPDIGEIQVSLATGRGGNHNASAFVIAKGGDAFLEAFEPVRDVADLGGVAEAYLLGEREAPAAARVAAI
ncbi:MAG: hypothetical protein QOF34_936 [Sphingomonadales bacterium]|nr:hypothetical protein [Sphingomonadales bacterium]